MPRRRSLLFAVVGLSLAVAIVVWLQRKEVQDNDSTPGVGVVNDWPFEPTEVSVDPDAAVATILELRSQFGSVLTNSELDVAETDGGEGDLASDPQSFGDFLREEAGVVSPQSQSVAEAQVELSKIGADVSLEGNTELAAAMHEIATILVARADLAKASGDKAQQQRFSGLATLLRAEAGALSAAERPIR